GTFIGLLLNPPPTEIAVNRKPLTAQCPRLGPAPTGRAPILRPIVATPQHWDRHRLSQTLAIALNDRLDLLGQFVPGCENRNLCSGPGGADVHPSHLRDALLPLLLRLIAGGPVHCLRRLAKSGWTSNQQVTGRKLALLVPPPEEEPLHNLPQPRLRFLGREES